MDNVIKNLKKKAFSDKDILNLCKGKTKIISYPELYNYKTIDEVLYPYNSVVILYETKPRYGHWICVLKQPKNTIEVFDSYGIPIDDELNFIDDNFRKKNNEVFPILSLLLLKSNYKIIYNKVKLQKYKNDVSSCGRHVCLRILLQDLSLKKYIKLLTNKKYDPDTIVTYLTSFV
jgi:hypothetical protein